MMNPSHRLLWSVCTRWCDSSGRWRCERSAPAVRTLGVFCQCVSGWSAGGGGTGRSAAPASPRRSSERWRSLQACRDWWKKMKGHNFNVLGNIKYGSSQSETTEYDINLRWGLDDSDDVVPQRLLLFVAVLHHCDVAVVGQVLLIGCFDVWGQAEEWITCQESKTYI